MRLQIAGLSIVLHDTSTVLEELASVYAEFDRRGQDYAAEAANPHLCRKGCSACCRRGAFFAVSLVEAVHWVQGMTLLPDEWRDRARAGAARLLSLQKQVFDSGDDPGSRDEATFTARVGRVARTGPACPLLDGDLCSTYADRPFLCRAYGFPVDAFAVESEDSLAFRSLCHLYEGHALRDFVRGRDLRDRLSELSRRLAGGRDVGRFTSAEAILAEISTDAAGGWSPDRRSSNP